MTGNPQDTIREALIRYRDADIAVNKEYATPGASVPVPERDEAWDELTRLLRKHPAALVADLDRYREALEQCGDPIMDEAFRARLLRHGLSNDEADQLVIAIEVRERIARAALAGAEGDAHHRPHHRRMKPMAEHVIETLFDRGEGDWSLVCSCGWECWDQADEFDAGLEWADHCADEARSAAIASFNAFNGRRRAAAVSSEQTA